MWLARISLCRLILSEKASSPCSCHEKAWHLSVFKKEKVMKMMYNEKEK